MGAKGLWRHVKGNATAPVLFAVSNGIPMLSDGKTSASEDQIEAKENKIQEKRISGLPHTAIDHLYTPQKQD